MIWSVGTQNFKATAVAPVAGTGGTVQQVEIRGDRQVGYAFPQQLTASLVRANPFTTIAGTTVLFDPGTDAVPTWRLLVDFDLPHGSAGDYQLVAFWTNGVNGEHAIADASPSTGFFQVL